MSAAEITLSPIDLHKALSDPTRLRCIMLLHLCGELCVCELMEACQEVQPKISRHLANLRKMQLLTDRRSGQWVFYRINDRLPAWVKGVIELSVNSNKMFVSAQLEQLQAMQDRPQEERVACSPSL